MSTSFDVITVVQDVCGRKISTGTLISAVSFPLPCVFVCAEVHPYDLLCVRFHGFSSLWAVEIKGAQTHTGTLSSFPTVIGAICVGCVNIVGGMLWSIIHNLPCCWTRAVMCQVLEKKQFRIFWPWGIGTCFPPFFHLCLFIFLFFLCFLFGLFLLTYICLIS